MITSTLGGTSPPETIAQLQRDLSVAIDRVPDGVLRNWGKEVASRFIRAGTKRITGLVSLASKLTVAVADEIFDLLQAFTRGNVADHMQNRLDAATRAANAMGTALKRTASAIGELAQRSPAEAATALLSFVVGFYAGSGGDGDGGLPDLDLMAGIGAHRSIFTHSILIGTVVETAVLSLVDLTKAIHAQLPDDRHPLWDQLLAAQTTASESFVTGASIGISAHLGIDSSVDGFTPYKDLPISLPMEAHRALLELNAAAEGIYGATRLAHDLDGLQSGLHWVTEQPAERISAMHQDQKLTHAPSVRFLEAAPIDYSGLRALPAEQRLKEVANLAKAGMSAFEIDTTGIDEAVNNCEQKVNRAREPFRLGVIGEFRSGKSTLINALLGEEVAFVDFIEATPVECVFRYGQRRSASICFKGGHSEPHTIEEVNDLLSTRREDHNWVSSIEYVEYLVPSGRLKSFDLWDAPGMGGSSANQAVAEHFLRKLSAALWVFDATLPGKATIAGPLHTLREEGKPVIAVVNRIDECKPEDLKDVIAYPEKIYPGVFARSVAISALESLEAAQSGHHDQPLESLWETVLECVGTSAEEGETGRISRAAEQACHDFCKALQHTRRSLQDQVGMLDHVRENLSVSKQRVLGQLEAILAEETETEFKGIDVELSNYLSTLPPTSDVVEKIATFFNDSRAQHRISTGILERSLERVEELWRRYSNQAINLSQTAVATNVGPSLHFSGGEAAVAEKKALEEGIYTGGLSLAIAAAIAATTSVTWPAVLIAIPIGSLSYWKKKRELIQGSAKTDVSATLRDFQKQFISSFLPSARDRIGTAIDAAMADILSHQCRQALGRADLESVRQLLDTLRSLEGVVTDERLEDQDKEWNEQRLLRHLENPGPRLDLFIPDVGYSLSPILQALPPSTVIRLVITGSGKERDALTRKVATAFGNWQGKRSVLCVTMPDGSSITQLDSLVVTTDVALITKDSLSQLGRGHLRLSPYPNGHIAGESAFAKLLEGWTTADGQLIRIPIY